MRNNCDWLEIMYLISLINCLVGDILIKSLILVRLILIQTRPLEAVKILERNFTGELIFYYINRLGNVHEEVMNMDFNMFIIFLSIFLFIYGYISLPTCYCRLS